MRRKDNFELSDELKIARRYNVMAMNGQVPHLRCARDHQLMLDSALAWQKGQLVYNCYSCNSQIKPGAARIEQMRLAVEGN